MICEKCNLNLPDDSDFCQFCGTALRTPIPPAVSEINEEQTVADAAAKETTSPPKTQAENGADEPNTLAPAQPDNDTASNFASKKPKKAKNPKKAKKPVNKKLVIYVTVIPITLALIAALAVFVLAPYLTYVHAKTLLENGEYDLAYAAFSELDEYLDSESMLPECRYIQAVKYRETGDFEFANTIFASLGDYKDSASLIHKHEYQLHNTVPATCTATGTETYKCSGCEETYSKTITQDHSYSMSASETASCQQEGYKTFTCSFCHEEYTEKYGKTSHKSVISFVEDATCLNAGTKGYQCSVCGFEYIEEIPKQNHQYSPATCTEPETCTSCGQTNGTALGHSDLFGTTCYRCGEVLFEPLTFSGHGVGNITGIDLPKGTYNFIITHSGSSGMFVYFTLEFNGNRIYDSGTTTSYVHRYTTDGLKNGYFNITQASGDWTITIEAV